MLSKVRMPAMISLLYFFFALISFNFSTIAGGSATLIWLPSGLAIAAILATGPRVLIGIYIAGVADSLYIGNNLDISLLFAVANTLEPLVALLILKKLPFSKKLDHYEDYLYLIAAGMVGAIVSALIGAITLFTHDYISMDEFLTVMINWWNGNVIGVVLLGPLLLMLIQTSFHSLVKDRKLEFGLLMLAVSYISVTVFAGFNLFGGAVVSNYSHLALGAVIWTIIRFNHQSLALIIMLFFSAGVWGFVHHQGYFFDGIAFIEKNIDLLFQYIFVVSAGTMGLAYTLKQQRTLSQALIKSKTEAYICNQDNLQLEFLNLSARRNLGIEGKSWQGLSLVDLQTEESKAQLLDSLEKLSKSDSKHLVYQGWHQRFDDTSYPVEVTVEQIEQSGQCSYLATAIDISDRIEQELYKDLGDSVCQHSTQGVAICDENNQIIRVNKAFTQITGYSEEDVMGKNPNILRSGSHDRSFYARMRREFEKSGSWNGELYNRHKQGHLYLAKLTIKRLMHSVGKKVHYVAMFTDITAEREQTLQLKHHAEHDLLTALPNRIRLQQEFSYTSALANRHDQKLALLFLDLDGFKPVNDLHGHSLGDSVLQEVANRLKSSVRETDIVARVGGDEFVVLMGSLEQGHSYQILAEKIRKTIAEPIHIDGETVLLSVSIGGAVYPSDAKDLDGLISIADEAMYSDKQSKNN